MIDFVNGFEERLHEIEIYLDLLDSLEKQVQTGPPKIGATGVVITVEQVRILYSSVYLQLYNLVESTVSRCIEAVTAAIAEMGPWQPKDLIDELRSEWVRSVARTNIELLNPQNRFEAAMTMCNHLIAALPVVDFEIHKGGGGNWDDVSIEEISVRLGVLLEITPEVKRKAKMHFRNDQSSLVFIRKLRNNLAHGSISFVECGEGVTVADLRDLEQRTASYLREVVTIFKSFIDTYLFVRPNVRP